MRLLVSCIPFDGGKSGISTYVRELTRELAAQGHDLTLLCEPDENETRKAESGEGGTGQGAFGLQLSGFNIIHAPRWTRRAVFSMLWHLFLLPFWIRRHRREFDGFVICAANRRVCAFYPLPTTATVHDLANFHVPGKYSRMRMFYLAHVLPFFAKRAQRLVAVSGATKSDMVKFWRCREKDVTVLYNGLRTADCGLKADTGKPKPGVQSLLYISRIEHPGKNHVRLIEAYGSLPRPLAEAHPLVIAGADWKDAEAVHDAASKSPHADLIRFTGFVPSAEMGKLWSEAGFYVFPSLFEGFGLSLIEAMARGVPCACSNNGSLGEIAGDVAITFNPEDPGAIADAIVRLVSEPAQEREARIERGLEWARRFSWVDHASGIAKLIAEAQGEGREVHPASRAPCPSVSNLFGIPVACVTEMEAVERVVTLARERRERRGRAAFVATLNVDFVCNAVKGWPFGGNDELWGYLRNADLVTADGMPIVLLSRILLRRLPERVTGADMVPAICRRCAEEGLTVYVLGGFRKAVEEAFEKLAMDYGDACPSLRVVGIDPSFVRLNEDQPDIVERINAAKPDVLFVALGNPKQELWMGRHADMLDVGAIIGVGGTFNFIAGHVRRAPKWVQRHGLEWIYRIIQEPKRLWRRYAYGVIKFSWLSLLAVFGAYRQGSGSK